VREGGRRGKGAGSEGGRKEGGRGKGVREAGGSEGRRGEGRRGEGVGKGEGVRKGERVMVGGENHAVVREGCWALITVCGWWWWVFIAIRGGGHLACLCCACLLFAGAYRCPWWWALDLPSSFLSQRDMAADGQGRGDVDGASHQPPVGSQQWWCCVSGVGGNRRHVVAYRIHYKTTMLSLCIAWLPHCIQQRGLAHLWGRLWHWGHGVQFLWVLVIMWWQSFVGWLLSPGSQGCLQW